MGTFFILLSFVALIVLAVGLVRPSIVKLATRRKVGMWYGGAFILLLIIGISVTPTEPSVPVTVTSAPAPVQAQNNATTTPKPVVTQKPAPVANDSVSVAKAQKELDDFMALAEKAGLVHSYEFSDTDHVVYIDSVWYTQDVQFKKDFLAKVTMLRAIIVGTPGKWDFFKVRDAYSNEVVAEVTAFTGSLEVYK